MRTIKIFTAILLLSCFCFGTAGCVSQPETLPLEEPIEMVFSSGAGAWGTSLTLNSDGTFTGGFHDSNMGEQGDGYPNGTVYLSDFSGKFTQIKKLDSHSYEMYLTELTTEQPEGKEWIEDDIRYVCSNAYGLENGERFVFYLPETPIEGLNEFFLNWWPGYYPVEDRAEYLDCFGLQNTVTGDGFFSYDFLNE